MRSLISNVVLYQEDSCKVFYFEYIHYKMIFFFSTVRNLEEIGATENNREAISRVVNEKEKEFP